MATEQVETAVYKLRIEGQEQIDALTRSINELGEAEEDATRKTRTTSEELQKRIARYDPLLRAQRAYTEELQNIARYQETGVGTQQEINALFEGATKRYQSTTAALHENEKALTGHANASKLSRYELINLSRQMQDVGVSLFSGQSPLMVLVQQGSQIADVFASSQTSVKEAFKGMAASAIGFLGTGGIIATGVAAAGAALAYLTVRASDARKQMELALSGPGAATGMQPADITNFTQQNASLIGASRGQLKELAEDWVHTGKIAVNELTGVGEAVLGLSVKTKTGFAEAGGSLKKLFAADDLTKAVDELSGTYPELNANIRASVDALQQQGERAKATQLIIDTMAESNRKAAASQSALTMTSNLLSNALQFRPFEGQAKSLEDRLRAAQANLAMTQRPELGFSSAEIETARQDVARLNEELTKLKETAEQTKLNMIGNEAQKMARDLDPTIQKLTEVRLAIQRVKEAQASGAPGANTPEVDALLIKLENEEARLTNIQQKTRDLNQITAELREKWGGVSDETARTLEHLQNQLPVAQAVGGAARMEAQERARILDLQNQGVKVEEAALIAAAEKRNEQARANTAIKEQIHSLEDSTRLIKAQANGTGEAAERAIAYDNAIRSGASQTEAAALSAAMLANQMARSAESAGQYQARMQAATQAMMGAAGRGWMADQTYMATSFASRAAGEPGTFVGTAGSGGSASLMPGIYPGMTQAEFDRTVKMYEGGPSEQFKEQMAKQQALTDSVDKLKDSTDSLNATNQELLSPYYTQDPRTSHIGFRSQGMATGGWVDVPGGYSANDNMVATIPVASGERIFVDPMGARRTATSPGHTTINISQPILIQGNANKDELGRTLFQSNQGLAKQIGAATAR